MSLAELLSWLLGWGPWRKPSLRGMLLFTVGFAALAWFLYGPRDSSSGVVSEFEGWGYWLSALLVVLVGWALYLVGRRE